jgi:hypothetical protein
MQCPRCQQDNPSHAKFCLECGTPVRRTEARDSPKASYADLERDLTESLDQQTASSEIWLMRSIEDIDFSAKREVDAKRVCL